MPAIGPSLPPHLAARGQHEEQDTTTAAPQQPSKSATGTEHSSSSASAAAAAAAAAAAGASEAGMIGFAVPVATELDERKEIRPEQAVMDDSAPELSIAIHDDDSWAGSGSARGKSAATTSQAELSEGARRFLEREQRMREASNSDAKQASAPAKRDEWMLRPPSPKSLAAQLGADPSSALKARGFSQGGRIQSRGGAAGMGDGDDGSLWTETPAEREQRVREEELGIRGRKALGEEKSVTLKQEQERQRERAKEEEIRRAIRDHDPSRGTSLLEQHRKARVAELKAQSDKNEKHSSSSRGRDERRDGHRSGKHQRSGSGSSSDSEDTAEARRRRRKRSERGKERDRSRSRSPRRSSGKSRHRQRSRSRSVSNSESEDEERRRRRKRREREHRDEKEARRARRKAEKAKEEEKAAAKERRAREEKEKATPMLWDREAVLGQSGKMFDDKKKAAIIRDAAGLRDRFGTSSSGAFLK